MHLGLLLISFMFISCHDNKVSIEFSPAGFYVKDLPSKKVKFQGQVSMVCIKCMA